MLDLLRSSYIYLKVQDSTFNNLPRAESFSFLQMVQKVLVEMNFSSAHSAASNALIGVQQINPGDISSGHWVFVQQISSKLLSCNAVSKLCLPGKLTLSCVRCFFFF